MAARDTGQQAAAVWATKSCSHAHGPTRALALRSSRPQGVQLARSLASQADPLKQSSEVALYFERFEAAEEAYRKMDRLDLAVALRSRLGEGARFGSAA